MARQSAAQKHIVSRVMSEFSHGALEQPNGQTVKNPKQAIAIALNEAGASNRETPAANQRHLRATKRRERAQRQAHDSDANGAGRTSTRAALYAEARRRNLRGRSKMSRSDLQRALQASAG